MEMLFCSEESSLNCTKEYLIGGNVRKWWRKKKPLIVNEEDVRYKVGSMNEMANAKQKCERKKCFCENPMLANEDREREREIERMKTQGWCVRNENVLSDTRERKWGMMWKNACMREECATQKQQTDEWMRHGGERSIMDINRENENGGSVLKSG